MSGATSVLESPPDTWTVVQLSNIVAASRLYPLHAYTPYTLIPLTRLYPLHAYTPYALIPLTVTRLQLAFRKRKKIPKR